MTLDAVIVGCGRIGSTLDDGATGDRALTHATGYELHDRINLVAGVDPDPNRRDRFTANRNRPAYDALGSVLDDHDPDLVSVCTPAGTHAAVIDRAIDAGVTGILCEKPLAPDATTATEIVERCERAGVTLAVGYMRRYLPGCRIAKAMLDRGVVGDGVRALVTYNKGFVENGSHLVDLARWWFGESEEIEHASIGSGGEPDATVRFEAGECQFFHIGNSEYNHVQVDVHGDAGRLQLLDNGATLRVQSIRENPRFPGFYEYDPSDGTETGFRWMFYFVVDDFVQSVADGGVSACTGVEALHTLDLCERIADTARGSPPESVE